MFSKELVYISKVVVLNIKGLIVSMKGLNFVAKSSKGFGFYHDVMR